MKRGGQLYSVQSVWMTEINLHLLIEHLLHVFGLYISNLWQWEVN